MILFQLPWIQNYLTFILLAMSALERSFAASESGRMTAYTYGERKQQRKLVARLSKLTNLSRSDQLCNINNSWHPFAMRTGGHYCCLLIGLPSMIYNENSTYSRISLGTVMWSKQSAAMLLYTHLPPWLGGGSACPFFLSCLTSVPSVFQWLAWTELVKHPAVCRGGGGPALVNGGGVCVVICRVCGFSIVM